MNRTLLDKTKRLMLEFWTNPGSIIRWGKNWSVEPIDSELPWTSWGAIDFLNYRLRKEMVVFEYGSGGSTFFFARRTHRVMSVEDDDVWFRRVGLVLSQRAIDNVDLIFRESTAVPYSSTQYVQSLDSHYDVILIDGHEHRLGVDRMECFRRAEQFVRPGGMIVLDGAWKFPLDITQTRAKDADVFSGVGPGRKWVTRTDIYHY